VRSGSAVKPHNRNQITIVQLNRLAPEVYTTVAVFK
jgi:hypothetical protein